MAEIKGIFFDLGGTLRIADDDPDHKRRALTRMAELAGDKDPLAFIETIEQRYEPYRDWALSENKEEGDFGLWKNWLLPEFPDEKLEEICHEMTYQYRQYKGLRRVVDGGVETIKELKKRGYKLAIISNLIGENEIPDWLKEDGLDQYFDAVVLSSVTHIRKPDPEMYRIAAREMGVEVSECINVADNLKRDFHGAKAAGIGANVMYVDETKRGVKKLSAETYPDFIIFKFTDLLKIPLLKDKENA